MGTTKGSITSVQAIYVPADDLTDPAPATTFAHLDATTVLSRPIAELGIYPAVDPLDSTSRILDVSVVGEAHYKCARDVQKILQDYKSLQDIIAILGMDGRFVALEDTIAGFNEVLDGKHDDKIEGAFYMVGDIKEVASKNESLTK